MCVGLVAKSSVCLGTCTLHVANNPTSCQQMSADEPQMTPSKMHIPPPAYQQGATSFKLDLSCLSANPQCQPDVISAIDSQAIQWPMTALRQATTLDDSQLRALQVCLPGAHSISLCMTLCAGLCNKQCRYTLQKYDKIHLAMNLLAGRFDTMDLVSCNIPSG